MNHLGGEGFFTFGGKVPNWPDLFRKFRTFFIEGLEKALENDLENGLELGDNSGP